MIAPSRLRKSNSDVQVAGFWPRLLLSMLFGGLLLAPVISAAAAAEEVASPATVYLEPSTDWSLQVGGQPYKSLLMRELYRQSFLLAAREELGLVGRDGLLGDPMPQGGKNTSFRIAPGGEKGVQFRLLRGGDKGPQVVLRHQAEPLGGLDLSGTIVELERLSRSEFVESLKSAGFSRRKIPTAASDVNRETIESYLKPMTFSSQYFAVRSTHDLIRTQGPSDELYELLVRGYANLGVLTELNWHPAHEVFKARALLYSERMIAAAPDSPAGYLASGYAKALVGWHSGALESFGMAREKLGATTGEKGALPDWVAMIEAYCHFDVETLAKKDVPEALVPLQKLLRYLDYEQANTQSLARDDGLATAQEMPECYRIYAGMCLICGDLASQHPATSIGPAVLAGRLWKRLDGDPNLPPQAREFIAKFNKESGQPEDEAFEFAEPDDQEMKARVELIALLHASSAAPADDALNAEGAKLGQVIDVQEPSWATLGSLIRDLSFQQTARRAHFIRGVLGAQASDYVDSVWPLVAGHRYEVLFGAFDDDPQVRYEAGEKIVKLPLYDMELAARPIFDVLEGQARVDVYNRQLDHLDMTASGLAIAIHTCHVDDQDKYAYPLYKLSPHSPLAREKLVYGGWKEWPKHAAQWEKESVRHPAPLIALGIRYLHDKDPENGKRCLQAALKISPEPLAYTYLAKYYYDQQDYKQWKKTLDDFLETPPTGIEHARIRKEIAKYFIQMKQWDEAKPYAEGAAQAYSAWGLNIAADVHEGLQEFAEAEQYYRAMSMRYEGSRQDWYHFCRRTGTGDVAAARELAQMQNAEFEGFDNLGIDLQLASFFQLEGKYDEALSHWLKAAQKQPDPFYLLQVALIAEELKKADVRDQALATAVEKGVRFINQATGEPRTGLVYLAQMLRDDLAAETPGKFDFPSVNAYRKKLASDDRWGFDYFLGKYLDLQGNAKDAKTLWLGCMGNPDLGIFSRTLAGTELVRHGVKPIEYRRLLLSHGSEDEESDDATEETAEEKKKPEELSEKSSDEGE